MEMRSEDRAASRFAWWEMGMLKRQSIINLYLKITSAKSMANYNDLLIEVERLTPDEQLRLLEYLAALIRQHMGAERERFSVGDAARSPLVEDSSLNPTLRRKKIVDILEKIAASNVFGNVSNPVEWQRELRQYRSLSQPIH